ncbi:MAG: hypothetical protein ACK2T0_11345 [Anaerolineales bacterium]
MANLIFGVFLVLHGLVHLLYLGQSQRFFELQPGMTWPDRSWAFSRLLGNAAVRNLASILLAVAAAGLIAGGAGVLARQGWWRPVVLGAAALSALIYVFLWDGSVRQLDNKGAVGILISLAVLVVVLLLRWPQFE